MGCTDSEFPLHPQVEILGAKDLLMGWMYLSYSEFHPGGDSGSQRLADGVDVLSLQWITSPSPGGDPGSQRIADGMGCTYSEFPPLPQVEILGVKDSLMGCDGMYLQ